MKFINAIGVSLGIMSVRGRACDTTDDCNAFTYGAGGCCLNEEEHWGGSNQYVSQLCRSEMEMSFYTNSFGWDSST